MDNYIYLRKSNNYELFIFDWPLLNDIFQSQNRTYSINVAEYINSNYSAMVKC